MVPSGIPGSSVQTVIHSCAVKLPFCIVIDPERQSGIGYIGKIEDRAQQCAIGIAA